ncbi:MAG: hypothetical protein KDK25_11475 [Leptospiraceae bacterium]|nr:hypothetical protein [Leptospiraceae bacterium]
MKITKEMSPARKDRNRPKSPSIAAPPEGPELPADMANFRILALVVQPFSPTIPPGWKMHLRSYSQAIFPEQRYAEMPWRQEGASPGIPFLEGVLFRPWFRYRRTQVYKNSKDIAVGLDFIESRSGICFAPTIVGIRITGGFDVRI